DFKLVANCDGNIGKITTSLGGNPSVELPYLISPLSSDNSSTTEYIAKGSKLRNASDTEFIPPDGSK
ncbi:fimbrial protein, partial [Escherichia coli]|nr:fimbrial protein [Escherichia coli]